jgi:hypothetical protein
MEIKDLLESEDGKATLAKAVEEETLPIRLTHSPTTCRVRRRKILGNQGLMEL